MGGVPPSGTNTTWVHTPWRVYYILAKGALILSKLDGSITHACSVKCDVNDKWSAFTDLPGKMTAGHATDLDAINALIAMMD